MKIPIGESGEILPGDCRMFQVGDNHVAVCNVGGTFHAIGNICPHRGAFLGQGTLKETVITCPWHNWQFDVTTGRGITNPHASVKTYGVSVHGGKIMMELSAQVANNQEADDTG